MAGDWIKLEHATLDKPEVWRMAALLKIKPEQVLGHLFRVWVWADQVSTNVDESDSTFVDTELSTVDSVARLHGFADAMLAVHWLAVDNSRVEFPHLRSYISETAKTRALRNRAQQKWRANVDSHQSTYVDSRRSTKVSTREEKSLNPPTPLKRGDARKKRSTSKAKSNGNGKRRGRMNDVEIQVLGIKYGLAAHPGETADAYRERILAEDRRRHHDV